MIAKNDALISFFMKHMAPQTLVLLAVLGVGTGPGLAQDRKDAKLFQEYVAPLKGPADGRPPLLLIGDNAAEFVKFEPEGVRISLPAGFDGERPSHGVNSGMTAKGDFEINAAFEVLKEPGFGDAGPKGTKVHLLITVDKPPWDLAGFSRHQQIKFPAKFTAWRNEWNKEARKNKQQIKWFEVKGAKWRFRLARSGSVLSYLLAEEDEADFRLLQQYAFVEDDVKDIRVVTTTGGPQAALDVRVTDLRIRAESLPNLGAIPPIPPAHEEEPPVRGDWLLWLVLGLVVILLFALSLLIWQRRRARKAAAANPQPRSESDLTVQCAECGASLKVKPGLAGKKVKCPRCGHAIAVPAAD